MFLPPLDVICDPSAITYGNIEAIWNLLVSGGRETPIFFRERRVHH